MSPDCSAVKRSLADSGTNLTLLGSLKMAAAMARQTSTSIPVQLPLSSGAENPGRPWLTPQDNMPRSVTALRVWALAACIERPAARTRAKTRDTHFMAKPFKGPKVVQDTFACRRTLRNGASLASPLPQIADLTGGFALRSRMDQRSRQAPNM